MAKIDFPQAPQRINIFSAIGWSLLALTALTAIVSCVWTPYDVEILSLKEKFLGAGADHWLGTDHLGRDLLSMIMIATGNSVFMAFFVTLSASIPGAIWGCTAAMRAGLFDEVLMRAGDIIFAFPALVSAILMTAIWGHHAENMIIALSLFNMVVFARLARASTLSIRSLPFITAAQAIGRSFSGTIMTHVLPTIKKPMLTQAASCFSLSILAESGFSYVGIGVQPPSTSLGRMLWESRTMLDLAPHTALFPGLAIFVIVFGALLLAHSLPDPVKICHSKKREW